MENAYMLTAPDFLLFNTENGATHSGRGLPIVTVIKTISIDMPQVSQI